MKAEEPELDFSPAGIFARLGNSGSAQLLHLLKHPPEVDLLSIGQQLSMHLPRMTADEIASEDAVLAEAERLANRLRCLRKDYKPEIASREPPSLRALQAQQIEPSIAEAIFSRYHYLLSHRKDSFSLGLKACPECKWPFVIASLSPFDLHNVVPDIPLLEHREAALVLSRLFGFPWAPRNSISYLMKQIRSYIRDKFPEVKLLLTYVNPNVGFRSASYRADNWVRLGEEIDTTYLYVDDNYRTDRSLAREYGTASVAALSRRLGQRFQISRYRLRPLSLLARGVRQGALQKASSATFPRWSPIES